MTREGSGGDGVGGGGEEGLVKGFFLKKQVPQIGRIWYMLYGESCRYVYGGPKIYAKPAV